MQILWVQGSNPKCESRRGAAGKMSGVGEFSGAPHGKVSQRRRPGDVMMESDWLVRAMMFRCLGGVKGRSERLPASDCLRIHVNHSIQKA